MKYGMTATNSPIEDQLRLDRWGSDLGEGETLDELGSRAALPRDPGRRGLYNFSPKPMRRQPVRCSTNGVKGYCQHIESVAACI